MGYAAPWFTRQARDNDFESLENEIFCRPVAFALKRK